MLDTNHVERNNQKDLLEGTLKTSCNVWPTPGGWTLYWKPKCLAWVTMKLNPMFTRSL